MAIYKNNNEITALWKNGHQIQAVYLGIRMIWQGIRSCFGAGYWISEKPWLSSEGWKN